MEPEDAMYAFPVFQREVAQIVQGTLMLPGTRLSGEFYDLNCFHGQLEVIHQNAQSFGAVVYLWV